MAFIFTLLMLVFMKNIADSYYESHLFNNKEHGFILFERYLLSYLMLLCFIKVIL